MAPKKVKKSPTKPGKKSNARDSLSKNSIGRDIPLTTHPSSSTAIAKAAEKFAAIASSPEEESEEFQPTKKTQQSSRETDAVSEVPTEGSKGEIKRWEGKSKASRSIRSNVTQAELPFQVADLSKDQLIDTILHLVHLSLPSDHRDSFESFKKSVVSLDPSRVDPNVQARARWMRRVQDLTLKARPATQNEIVKIGTRYALSPERPFKPRYPWGREDIWSSAGPFNTENPELRLKQQRTRWESLTYALHCDGTYSNLLTSVNRDFYESGKLIENLEVQRAVDMIYENPEFIAWCDEDCAALIVNAQDENYFARSTSQTPGIRAIRGGRERISVASGFPHKLMMEFKDRPGLRLMHAGGMSHTCTPGNDFVIGWRGLLRSLCNQIISQDPYKTMLRLSRLTRDSLDELNRVNVTVETLLKLFRDLILEIADDAAIHHGSTQQILVIIDGIDWYEESEDAKPWCIILNFFDKLIHECKMTDLGTKIHFKYVVLHSLTSKLGTSPTVSERYIFLGGRNSSNVESHEPGVVSSAESLEVEISESEEQEDFGESNRSDEPRHEMFD